MLMFTALPFFHLLDFTTLETYHAARFEKETRYYVARISQDLLSDWIITITNGRINSRLGQSRTIAFQNFKETFDQFCLISKTRHQRGYNCTAYQSNSYLFVHLFAVLAANELTGVHRLRQQTLSMNRKSTPLKSKTSDHIGCQQLDFVFN